MHRTSCSLTLALALCLAVAACTSPFAPPTNDDLRRDVLTAIDRELRSLPDDESWVQTTVDPSPLEATLAERRAELDELTPAMTRLPHPRELGRDLSGEEQTGVEMSLEHAVRSAVRNNLSIQIAQLQPAITFQDVIIAESAFDAVFFAVGEFASIEEPTTVPVIDGIPLGTGLQAADTWRFETGVRQDFLTGGSAFISTDFARSRNRAPGIEISPDPAYAAAIRLGITQPLLRGFGRDVTESTILLTRNIQARSVEDLRSEFMQTVADTELAYWRLALAWQELEIRTWLVTEGVQVRDVLERRREFDVRPAEYADAVATVEQRQANIIRARRRVREASDDLKLLINDPELSVASEAVIFPSDAAIGSPITFNVRDAIFTAISNRPEIEQSRLLIDDAGIQQRLASNFLLPRLDLGAELEFAGLDGSLGSAYGDVFEGEFVNYLLGVTFEMPFGNREARAGLQQARLERSAAILNYQRTVQQVINDVKSALRDIVANYELIGATRSFRVAQAENLRALTAREALVGLTPEFLNLMFQQQETLGLARLQEFEALASFDQSVAELYRAMGTALRMYQIELEPANAANR